MTPAEYAYSLGFSARAAQVNKLHNELRAAMGLDILDSTSYGDSTMSARSAQVPGGLRETGRRELSQRGEEARDFLSQWASAESAKKKVKR